MVHPLTKRQKKILEHIARWIQKQGYPPSIREIGEALGIKSPRGVVGHLEALEKKGYLERERGARTIRIKLSSEGRVLTCPPTDAHTHRDRLEHVPVLGAVAAGSPLLAEENLEDHILVDERFVSGAGTKTFALRIKGESMVGAGILDRDYVLVQQQPKVDNGEIAAVLLDDEATVKRVYALKGALRLVSENPAIAPIEVREGDKRIQILGKVVGVMRRL